MALVRLTDLASMHPRLLWGEIAAALAIVGGETRQSSTFSFKLAAQNIPTFGTADIELRLDFADLPTEHLALLQRTYEGSRLVELAAIGIAGIGLYLAGGHEIREIALRGSGADYLVDDANHLLEIAGRSRRADFALAWRERCQRLSNAGQGGYYVCVSEFETPAGSLAFLNA